MRYISSTLLADEKIVYYTRPHWIVFVYPFIGFLLAILFIAYGPGWFVSGIQVYGYPLYDILAVIAALGGIYLLLSALIFYYSTEYGVTDKRVLMKTGWIRVNSLEIFLEKVEAVHVLQSVPGRILKYGTLVIIGTGGTKDPYYYIPNPTGFRKKVQQQIDLYEERIHHER